MKRKILKILAGIFVLFLIVTLIINQSIKSYVDNICTANEGAQAALILGARVYDSGRMSPIFRDRVDTALALYQAKRVEKLLVSGDHGQVDYDEVNAAREYLLERGVLEKDIFLDHAGFDTYDSVYRAKEIFGASSLIIVTQNFHLPRALYIADRLGIKACGQSADLQSYTGAERMELREVLARLKAFFNVNLNSKPHFLGDKIDLSGDGQLTWD
jgi:SanA protein